MPKRKPLLAPMPPDLVIRPSGVWNSRRPFANFLNAHKHHNKMYNVISASLGLVQYEARQKRNADRPVKGFFKNDRIGGNTNTALHAFAMSFPKRPDGTRIRPTMADVNASIDLAIREAREAAVITYVASFETFVQCWSLNYLLAMLEKGNAWTLGERRLAMMFSPVHRTGVTPNLPQIIDLLPFLGDLLELEPHVLHDRRSAEVVQTASTSDLNALVIIKFWRDFRNLLVHSENVVSAEFWKRHAATYERLRAPYPHMVALESNKPLRLYDNTFRALATTHYRAASSMDKFLKSASEGRRGGLVDDPSDEGATSVIPPAPPLLLPEDHAASYRWCSDGEYRLTLVPALADA